MLLSPLRRWLLATAAFTAACAGASRAPFPAPAQAASPSAGQGDSPSGDEQSPPPGVDLTKLDDFERRVFFRVVNRESSACGKGHTLLHSAKHDASCRASFYAVRYVAHLVDSGFTDSEISEKLDKRFRAPRIQRIDVSAAPRKGNANGRVTVVEFVDYECPHCKHTQTLLQQAVEAYPNDVKVFFKHFPLSSHTNARLAAEGAVAAHRQGKFWPYSDKVWANSDNLTPAVIEKAAKEAGLDFARWRADAESDAAKKRVEADKSEGGEIGIIATPSIFINGRRYHDPLEFASLKDWIDEELGR